MSELTITEIPSEAGVAAGFEPENVERFSPSDWTNGNGGSSMRQSLNGRFVSSANYDALLSLYRNSAGREVVDALQKFMDITSDESGWGTYKRMEGSAMYGEVDDAREAARAALAKVGK